MRYSLMRFDRFRGFGNIKDVNVGRAHCAMHAFVAVGFTAGIVASLRQALISATSWKVVRVLAAHLWSTRSTAMRAAVLLALLLVSLVFSHRAQAEAESGRIVLAQRILSCGELANTLYLQYT